MNEPIYYDIVKEEYITESYLRNEYEIYLDNEDNDYIDFNEFVSNCLTINGGILEQVGF